MKKKSSTKTYDAPTYEVELSLSGQSYRGVGELPLDAFRSMPLPAKVTNKGIVKLTDGTRTAQRFLYTPALRRLLVNRLAQEVFVHNLAKLLK